MFALVSIRLLAELVRMAYPKASAEWEVGQPHSGQITFYEPKVSLSMLGHTVIR